MNDVSGSKHEPLKEYINRTHSGSQVEFAQAKGISKQRVWSMLKSGNVFVFDGGFFTKLNFYKNDRR